MITWKEAGIALLVISLLLTVVASAVMMVSKQKVGKIGFTIDSDIRTKCDGEDVEITPIGDNTSPYYANSWEATNDSGSGWTKSKPPEATITLGVEGGKEYCLSSSSSNAFKLALGSSNKCRLDKIKLMDTKCKDSNATLVLIIQLILDKDMDTSAATTPTNFQWNGEHIDTGLWNIVFNSKCCQVQLTKDDSEIGGIKDTHSTFYNFSRRATVPKTYKFKVHPVKSSDSAKSSWTIPGFWTVSDGDVLALDNAPAAVPAADNDNRRTSKDDTCWRWRNGGDSYLTSAWEETDGKWYYFDVDGCMATGWVEVSGKGYYLDPATGAIVTNARIPDNYQVNRSDKWVPGAQISGAQTPEVISVCGQRGYRLIPTFNPQHNRKR